MCSIHGWYAWGEQRPDPITLRGMLLCGAERGGSAPNYSNDATGVAYLRDGGIKILKDSGKAKDFVNNVKAEQWAAIAASPRGLMHNRARTKGAINMVNNHPLDAFGWVIVHNGTISNDDDLFGHFKDPRPAEVDSITIPLVLSKGKDYLDSIKQMSVLSGGVTTAAWKVDEPDKLMIGRWGPNELYMWWDHAAQILYWSSAYASSAYFESKALGSLRFQTVTRLPEDRVVLLTPEKARTFTLKRRPFLLPLDELKSYRASLTPATRLPGPAGTTGTPALVTTSDTTSKSISGSSGSSPFPMPGMTAAGGKLRWKWAPLAEAKNKPIPIAEQMSAAFLDRTTIQEMLAAKTPGYVTVLTGYGTWHWSTVVMGTGEVKTLRWFKPARRTKPFLQAMFGTVPTFPVVRKPDEAHAFDGKLALERFNLIETNKEGVSTIRPGLMCPICGVTQSTITWAYWEHTCRWCDVRSILPVGGTGA